MSRKHDNFDADEMMTLKDHHLGYSYCPKCRDELKERDLDGRPRMVCPNKACGFIFYQNPIPAAGVVVVENDKLLLVQRAHPPRVGWWCIPAGFMEWEENPRQTAVRELAEETGLEIELDGLFEVYSGRDDPRANAVLILYLGRKVGGELRAADDAEDVRFFSFDEIPDKIAFEAHTRAINDYCERYRS